MQVREHEVGFIIPKKEPQPKYHPFSQNAYNPNKLVKKDYEFVGLRTLYSKQNVNYEPQFKLRYALYCSQTLDNALSRTEKSFDTYFAINIDDPGKGFDTGEGLQSVENYNGIASPIHCTRVREILMKENETPITPENRAQAKKIINAELDKLVVDAFVKAIQTSESFRNLQNHIKLYQNNNDKEKQEKARHLNEFLKELNTVSIPEDLNNWISKLTTRKETFKDILKPRVKVIDLYFWKKEIAAENIESTKSFLYLTAINEFVNEKLYACVFPETDRSTTPEDQFEIMSFLDWYKRIQNRDQQPWVKSCMHP